MNPVLSHRTHHPEDKFTSIILERSTGYMYFLLPPALPLAPRHNHQHPAIGTVTQDDHEK